CARRRGGDWAWFAYW
nr:immunoglobulin heavy chain junction region [Mus musculus]